MKLIAFLLMLPLFSLAKPFNETENTLQPEGVKFGKHVKTVNKFLTNKSKKLSDGVTFHYCRLNAIKIANVTIKDAFVESYNGAIKSFSLELDKKNGSKLLANVIKKYGMPLDDVIDVLEWKLGEVVFEIHETNTGYLATYKPLHTDQYIASNN